MVLNTTQNARCACTQYQGHLQVVGEPGTRSGDVLGCDGRPNLCQARPHDIAHLLPRDLQVDHRCVLLSSRSHEWRVDCHEDIAEEREATQAVQISNWYFL